MADNVGTGLPNWTSKEEKRGIDPLGMQTTSVALYQQLVPGISNVTLRMRYYGFYAWLAQCYAKDVGNTSVDVWCQYLRRAEALYSLVASCNGGEQGVAGILWAARKLDETIGNRVVFRANSDRDSGEAQYLQQKFGAFGAAYGSQLVAIGILEYVEDHEIPVLTEGVGDAIARAFETAIGQAGGSFLAAAKVGSVTTAGLEQMLPMLPSQIGKTSRERKLYQDLLFGKPHLQHEGVAARSCSLRLILRTAQSNAGWLSASDVRWTMYASRNRNGEQIDPLPADEDRQKFAWQVYQANDLLHVAYETLMKFALDMLSVPPSGMPMEQLVSKVVSRLLRKLKERKAGTWRQLLAAVALADDPWSEKDKHSEYFLTNTIFERANSVGIGTDEWGASAVLLLAVLHKRFAHQLETISSEVPMVGPAAFMQSIVTELSFLEEHAEEPLADLLVRLVKQRVLERHLWVAIQKFRGQGDYTFLLESDEGRVRVRQKSGPVLTNPRLSSAIAFLADIHLLGEHGPTAEGLRVLEAA